MQAEAEIQSARLAPRPAGQAPIGDGGGERGPHAIGHLPCEERPYIAPQPGAGDERAERDERAAALDERHLVVAQLAAQECRLHEAEPFDDEDQRQDPRDGDEERRAIEPREKGRGEGQQRGRGERNPHARPEIGVLLARREPGRLRNAGHQAELPHDGQRAEGERRHRPDAEVRRRDQARQDGDRHRRRDHRQHARSQHRVRARTGARRELV